MTRSPWLLMCAALAACAPTFDWREVRPPGSGLTALFPCKPQAASRSVALAGQAVVLTLHRCSAGDTTFAVGHADAGEPARVAPTLAALGAAAGANLGATAPVGVPLQVPGMTPGAQAQRLVLAGRLPDGSAVQGRVALFARGTQVYQATVIGERLDADAVETFFGALRLSS